MGFEDYQDEFCTDLILERTLELGDGDIGDSHPKIMSCGGIFVPRPRAINPSDPLYHILYTPNNNQPTKIVSALITNNILDELMNKENLN